MKRALVTLAFLALMLPSVAMARGDYHPEEEFELHDWVPIHWTMAPPAPVIGMARAMNQR